MDNQFVLIVHGTQRFRDRVPGVPVGTHDRSTTFLGSWYGGLLRWRPEVAMLVNEVTLLPLLLPLAPARTLLARLPEAIAGVLAAHNVPRELIEDERAAMADIRVAPTANRSVVGMVNEFGYLASAMRADFAGNLLGLAVHLARTPCSPLYGGLVSPDRELASRVAEHIAH